MNRPLDEVAHPLLDKANEHFANGSGSRERIRAVDDQVLYKVKVQRWRGAVWIEPDLPPLITDTRTAPLLPDGDDRLRYRLEAGARLVRRLAALIPALVRDSLRDGREHTADLDAFGIAIQVRADHGHETYVAIGIRGSVRVDLAAVILDLVPGCDPDGWYPEASLPERRLGPNEHGWSNIMDTAAAAKLLDV